jgi:V8-like Glu-specific endopeptidase
MGIALSNRIVTAFACAVLAAGLQTLAPSAGGATPASAAPAAAAGRSPGSGVTQAVAAPGAPAAAVRYWTAARMSAALQAAGAARPAAQPTVGPARNLLRQPAAVRGLVRKTTPATTAGSWRTGDTSGAGLRWTHAGAVSAAVGKIFFTLGAQNYVCSGTLVASGPVDVVLTAAHCVTNAQQPGHAAHWATNWVFVPGFSNGAMPYGEYTARQFFTAPGWTGPQGGTEQYDVAFVQVTPATLDAGIHAAAPPPPLPAKFAGSQDTAPASQAYVFGYPADPPYSGLYLNYCAGPAGASGGSARLPCAMTAGDSGGPWLAGFSPGSGGGQVVAITTYKISDDMRVLYGAVLGPAARAVYARAVSPGR